MGTMQENFGDQIAFSSGTKHQTIFGDIERNRAFFERRFPETQLANAF